MTRQWSTLTRGRVTGVCQDAGVGLYHSLVSRSATPRRLPARSTSAAGAPYWQSLISSMAGHIDPLRWVPSRVGLPGERSGRHEEFTGNVGLCHQTKGPREHGSMATASHLHIHVINTDKRGWVGEFWSGERRWHPVTCPNLLYYNAFPLLYQTTSHRYHGCLLPQYPHWQNTACLLFIEAYIAGDIEDIRTEIHLVC